MEESDYTKEEFDAEQEKVREEAWKGMFDDKKFNVKIEEIKKISVIKDKLLGLQHEWYRVRDSGDADAGTKLKKLYGLEGTKGMSKLIMLEMGKHQYQGVDGAQEVPQFVEQSQDLWIHFNRKINVYLEIVNRTFGLVGSCINLLDIYSAKVKELKEEIVKEPEEEPEPELTEEEKSKFMQELSARIDNYNTAYNTGNWNLAWQRKGSVFALAGKNKQKKDITKGEFERRKVGKLENLKKLEQAPKEQSTKSDSKD